MPAHGRPLGGGDAVDRGVAQRAIGRALVVAQYAVQLRPQAFDRAPALGVEAVGSELDRDAVQRLEGVRQQQENEQALTALQELYLHQNSLSPLQQGISALQHCTR